MADKILVAIDNGYAEQKVAYWGKSDDGNKVIKTLMLPSRAQIGAHNITIDGVGSGVYVVGGMPYTVGANVLEPEQMRSKNYATSEVNNALVNNSLMATGFGGQDVVIATGLPYGHVYTLQGEKDESFLRKVEESLKVECECKSGEVANIVGHHIYPESIAAFVDYALDEKSGGFISIETGLVVIDIGGNTTDISFINPGSPVTVNTSRSGTKEIGVLKIRDDLKKLVCTKFSIDTVTDAQLDKALRTGKLPIYGNDEDVSDLVTDAKRQTVKRLNNYIEEIIGDGAYLDKMLYVGGGAAILQKELRSQNNAQVPESPEFANARGMLKYLTFVDHG